jgi:Di-haem oxidoreductase, putative peroxidase
MAYDTQTVGIGLFAFVAVASAASAAGLVLQPKAGDPLNGLTATQVEQFWAGRVSYATPFGPETGLGPVMNKSNCQSCHSNPVGGWGSISVTRFGADNKGEFIPLENLGGSLLQSLSISETCREFVPAEATVIASRLTNSSLAFGLVEAIPDAAIAANEDPLDSNADGVSGRVHWVLPLESSPTSPLRAGRFGWKAQVATVLTFSGDATRNEMGITNALIPTETAPNGDAALLAACDAVADPEDHADASGLTFIQRVTNFQRYLAQPPQTPKSGMTGEAVFNAIGCNKCHVAQWTTASTKGLETAIRGQTIRPYSDFLLHDMGLLADGVRDGSASEQEFRTPTLWNLRTRDPMLHNGSASGGTFADRVTLAINAHGPFGEGANSATAFAALSANDKNQLIAFLDSLGRDEYDFDGNRAIDAIDLSVLASCRSQSAIHPDNPCAIGDINQDGAVDATDMQGFLLAAARDGVDTTADCDGDGTVDFVEIFNGAPDANFDGIPDNCIACPGDFNHDGSVNGADLAQMLSAWTTAGADLDGDGNTGGSDLAILLGNWGACN